MLSLLLPLLGCWALWARPASCTRTQHPSRVAWIGCHPIRVQDWTLAVSLRNPSTRRFWMLPPSCFLLALWFVFPETQYCVILIFRWAMTMKKEKIHLIFTANKIQFVLLPPSSSLHWVFSDSRICYRVLVGNSSSLFTVSTGDITASHSLNLWFFFTFVCLFFPSPTFPLAFITQLESTWMFKLLLRQTSLHILSVQRY